MDVNHECAELRASIAREGRVGGEAGEDVECEGEDGDDGESVVVHDAYYFGMEGLLSLQHLVCVYSRRRVADGRFGDTSYVRRAVTCSRRHNRQNIAHSDSQTVHFLATFESQSTSEAYTHSFVIPIESPPSPHTLKLDLVDPFPIPPGPNTIPRPIISLTQYTSTTRTQTLISPYPSTAPAPLRISQCGKVWFVLFEWPKSLVAARVYEQGLVSTLYGWVGEAEDWVTDMLGLTGRWTWRGQGGWHA